VEGGSTSTIQSPSFEATLLRQPPSTKAPRPPLDHYCKPHHHRSRRAPPRRKTTRHCPWRSCTPIRAVRVMLVVSVSFVSSHSLALLPRLPPYSLHPSPASVPAFDSFCVYVWRTQASSKEHLFTQAPLRTQAPAPYTTQHTRTHYGATHSRARKQCTSAKVGSPDAKSPSIFHLCATNLTSASARWPTCCHCHGLAQAPVRAQHPGNKDVWGPRKGE